MERTKRVRLLIERATFALIQREDIPREALQALDEAMALLRDIERDATRFHDLLETHPPDKPPTLPLT